MLVFEFTATLAIGTCAGKAMTTKGFLYSFLPAFSRFVAG